MSASYFKRDWMLFVFLSILVAICYIPSLPNTFVSDDIGAIVENGLLHSALPPFFHFSGSLRVSLYWLMYHLGNQPALYRSINIFFHIGAVWLVFLILRRLSTKAVGIIVATLFAIHPLMTESVTWISGGVYVQYAFFTLLAFYFYITAEKNMKRYAISILSFLMALSTSEKAIVFPFILLSYEVALGSLKINWKKISVFVLVSCIFFSFVFISGRVGNRISSVISDSPSSKIMMNPLLQLPAAISSYLFLILWPDKLTLYHSDFVLTPVEFLFRLFVTIAYLGGMVYTWKKNKFIFFWLSFFLISLLPTLTPLPIAWVVAERYVYLGTIGIITVIAYIAIHVCQKKAHRRLLLLLGTLIIVLLAARTMARNADWKNADALWIATARVSPSSAQNHNNLGDMYGRHGDKKRAVEEFTTAISINPSYAEAYHNLGNAYTDLGMLPQAIASYEKAVAFKPSLWQSYQNLAAVYSAKKDYKKAEQYLKQAIVINPSNSNLRTNLAVIYLLEGNKTEAKNLIQLILATEPTNKQAKAILQAIEHEP